MRFEQFEIQIFEGEDCVCINQDGFGCDRGDTIKLGLHQVPTFIAALKKAVAEAGKAD